MTESKRRRMSPAWSLGVLFVAAAIAGSGWAPAGRAEDAGGDAPGTRPGAKKFVMRPSMTLRDHIQAGADSVHAWVGAHRGQASDRHRMFEGLHELIRSHQRFADQIAARYPRNQLEWLLITDGVADTLTEALGPLLKAYGKANPEEILTEGRQMMESRLSRIAGPPSQVLGFHVVLLTDFALSKADSLLSNHQTQDRAGVEDGVLRNVMDWSQLYGQVHSDPIAVFQCRQTQTDWIVARLEDLCGHSGTGTWEAADVPYMAVVDRDSSQTPPLELFAYEYHLRAKNCPEDSSRVIYVDLPNFHEMQLEVYRRQQEGKLRPPDPTPGH